MSEEPVIKADGIEIWSDGSMHIENVAALNMSNPDAAVLRSIANSIEVAFPDAADLLRGIAGRLDG